MDCYNINSSFKYCDNNNEMQHLEKKKKKKSVKKQACGRKEVKLSTDPQSVAARERRHRISERFNIILQSLVPGGSKLDTVSMLEEAIVYVKFLKNQLWWLIHYHTHQHQHENINFNYNNTNNHVVLDDQPSTSGNDLIDPGRISTRDDSGVFLQNASNYDHEMTQMLEFQDSWFRVNEAEQAVQFGNVGLESG